MAEKRSPRNPPARRRAAGSARPPGGTGKRARSRPGGKRPARPPAARPPATPLLELAATWPFVSRRYMFGCNALLARGRLFFIEMDDSVVLRVGKDHLAAALRVRGAEGWNPWTPGAPGDWVSFPPSRRQIPKTLARWARTAYEASLKRKPPPKKRTRAPGRSKRSVARRRR